MIISLILLAIGFVLLTKGADYFIEGASAVAFKFKIPSIIIGLTIVAMGTSAPEAAVSIASALKGANGVAIGNVLGSNIANIFLILGITASICALTIQKNTIKYEIPFVAFITILLCVFGYIFGEVNRICALILLVLFVLFLLYLYKIAKNIEEPSKEASNLSSFKIILFLIGGLLALVYGSDLTVNSAIDIAHRLNISDRIIGLTVVAFGTSLPELATCIIAARKKQADIAIGNIIGSNIFNILFVLGIAGIIYPIQFAKEFLFDGMIALFAIVLLFVATCKTKLLSRFWGILFLVLYLIYIGYLIIK